MKTMLESGIEELVADFRNQGSPCAARLSIAERREGYLASVTLAGPAPTVASIEELQVEGIALRIYRPAQKNRLPVVIYFHGGCFVSGGFETHHQQLSQLASAAQVIVIAVSYRLVPESVYPAAHNDAFIAANWVYDNAGLLGIDKESVTLMGDSAGGHIALVTCLRLKNQGHWLPKRQVLIYPMLDASGTSPSYQEYGRDFVITAEMLLSGFQCYLKGAGVERHHPEISPLYRADFSGLPATYIVTAECDPLRDEGEELYRKLRAAGVNAYCQRYFGVIHGFFQLAAVSDSARRCMNMVTQLVKK